MNNNGPLSESQVMQLSHFLADHHAEESVSYPALCGFLFAVASAPEEIAESEWLPVVLECGLNEETETEKSEIGLMRQLLAYLRRQVNDESVGLPTACAPVATVMDNLQSDMAFSQWCAGFVSGHDWLEELWLEYVPDEMQDELASIVMVLSFFASDKLAKAYYAQLREDNRSFEVVTEQVLALHSEAMEGYARLGRGILQAMAQIKSETPPDQ